MRVCACACVCDSARPQCGCRIAHALHSRCLAQPMQSVYGWLRSRSGHPTAYGCTEKTYTYTQTHAHACTIGGPVVVLSRVCNAMHTFALRGTCTHHCVRVYYSPVRLMYTSVNTRVAAASAADPLPETRVCARTATATHGRYTRMYTIRSVFRFYIKLTHAHTRMHGIGEWEQINIFGQCVYTLLLIRRVCCCCWLFFARVPPIFHAYAHTKKKSTHACASTLCSNLKLID